MNTQLLLLILLSALFIPQLRMMMVKNGEQFKPSKTTKLDPWLNTQTYSSFFLPLVLIVCMITFIFFQPADDWKMLAMIIFLFSLLPAIVLNHFITYWKHIAIDSVVNDYSEKSIEIKFKTGEQIVLTKSNTKIVINHAIKRAWKRLFWGGFEYNVITLDNDKKITINSLETDVATLNLLLSYYGIKVIEIEYLDTSM